MKAARRVISIGYERRTVSELIATLLAHGVERVLDVRALPLSRRPGFCKTALAEKLAQAGIEYVHLQLAGNPYRALKDDPIRCLSLYSRHLKRHPEVVGQVARQLSKTGAVALLCYERRHIDCHRSRLTRSLVAADAHLQVVEVGGGD